ncbi:hypothetical protein Patl1_24844 [Pistacia atlantica]|uniref:Uncharacterized protein n=1 Tax=Pistacia atlantica TaxID=434234 RepID=A0ACC1B027_9ROSI|nr:hypothetical protein Patl1_24844 [Pistacia atlantica]
MGEDDGVQSIGSTSLRAAPTSPGLGFNNNQSAKLDRHRGDRYYGSSNNNNGNGGSSYNYDNYNNNDNQDSHYNRHSRPSRFSDGPMSRYSNNNNSNNQDSYQYNSRRRSPNNFRGSGGGGGGGSRPFDSPPRHPPGGGGGGGFRPMGGGGGGGGFLPMGGGFGSNYPVAPPPLPQVSGQKRGFSGRGSSPDRFDGGSFAKLFVGSVPKTATEEDIRPFFEEHGHVIEVALIKDKRTGQQQGMCECYSS